jgi:hypothetical protein
MPRNRNYSQSDLLLREALESYTVPNLRKLAGLLASNLPTRKAELIAIIQEHMRSPERLRQLWADLDTLQQAAVAEAVYAPSLSFDGTSFRAKYGQDPDWGTSRYGEFERPSRLRLFIYDGKVPPDLARPLKSFVAAPRAARVRTEDEPPATVIQEWYEYDYTTYERESHAEAIPVIRCDMERAAQHDVFAVLRLIDAGKVRASEKTKRVSAAGARAITEVLQGGDFYTPEEAPDEYATDPWPIKAFAWPLMLQSAGLANVSGTRLQLTPAGKKALASQAHEVIGKVWSRWLKTTLLDEFNRVNTIKGQTGKGKRAMTAAASRRAVIVEALQACPQQEWIAFDEFSRFMQAAGHTFEVSRDLWTLYITDPQYGSLGYAGFGEWHIVQGRYMLAFLFEYAATLGLVDIAYVHPSEARLDYGDLWGVDDLDCLSRYDGLLYFRINGLGAWCLGLSEAYLPGPVEVQQVLRVLPNLEVVATAPLDPGDILTLEQFSEPSSDVVWKIEPAKLLKALEEGYSVTDIETFLKARAGGELPDNVLIFLKEMHERASQLVDRGPARLIEARDAALAQLIVNDSHLKSLCMLAGERHIVVSAENESAFRRALREFGYGLPLSQYDSR